MFVFEMDRRTEKHVTGVIEITFIRRFSLLSEMTTYYCSSLVCHCHRDLTVGYEQYIVEDVWPLYDLLRSAVCSSRLGSIMREVGVEFDARELTVG